MFAAGMWRNGSFAKARAANNLVVRMDRIMYLRP